MSAVKIFVGHRDADGVHAFETWGSGHLDIAYHPLIADNFEKVAELGVKKVCAHLRRVAFGTNPAGLVDESFDEMLDHLMSGQGWPGAVAVAFDAGTHARVPVGIVFDEGDGTVDIYRPDVRALDDVPPPVNASADIGPYQCVLRVAEHELRRFGDKFQSLESMDINGPNDRMFWEEAFLRRRNKKILNVPTPHEPTPEEIRAAAEEKVTRERERQRRTAALVAAAEKNFARLEELCGDGSPHDVVWAAGDAGLRRGDPELLRFSLGRGFKVSWDDLVKLLDKEFVEAARAILSTMPQLLEDAGYGTVAPDLLCARGPKRIVTLVAAGAKIPDRIVDRAIELKNHDVLLVLASYDEKARVAVRDPG